MRIYIPTYGRGDHQPAYQQLAAAGYGPTLVTDVRDPFDYVGAGFDCVRDNFKDLKSKEHSIAARHFADRTPYMQVDDDLIIKRSPEGARIADMTARHWLMLLSRIDYLLRKGVAQIGVHHRTYVNFAVHPFTINKGQFPFRVKVYNPAVWKIAPRPCPGVDGHNDVWTWHELVRQGLDYATITEFCHVDQLYKAQRTHFEPDFNDKVKGFEPDFNDKVKGFDALIDYMGINRAAFTHQNKHGPGLLYAKLAKHYRHLHGRA